MGEIDPADGLQSDKAAGSDGDGLAGANNAVAFELGIILVNQVVPF